jgi:hypothetical protein
MFEDVEQWMGRPHARSGIYQCNFWSLVQEWKCPEEELGLAHLVAIKNSDYIVRRGAGAWRVDDPEGVVQVACLAVHLICTHNARLVSYCNSPLM